MSPEIIFLLVFVPILLFIGWLWWDEERELWKTYQMFGTTGFNDIDQRFRRIDRL